MRLRRITDTLAAAGVEMDSSEAFSDESQAAAGLDAAMVFPHVAGFADQSIHG